MARVAWAKPESVQSGAASNENREADIWVDLTAKVACYIHGRPQTPTAPRCICAKWVLCGAGP